jgi:hypothetical protein
MLMEAASASETSAGFYKTTLDNNMEDSHFYKCKLNKFVKIPAVK